MRERDKRLEVAELGKRRSGDEFVRRFKGYTPIDDWYRGAYTTTEYVSPITRSANNVMSDLVVVLNDWTSADGLQRGFNPIVAEHGYTPDLDTNVALRDFLLRYLGKSWGDVYITNAFAFVKPGSMQAPILRPALQHSVAAYLVEEIRIVAPSMVLCVGRHAYNGLRRWCRDRHRSTGVMSGEGLLADLNINDTRATSIPFIVHGAQVFGVPHTSRQAVNSAIHQERQTVHRGPAAYSMHWERVRDRYWELTARPLSEG